jgi:hypothetical protein
MIKNEEQYEITKKQFAEFASAVKKLKAAASASGLSHVLVRAQIAGLEYQAGQLHKQIVEYEQIGRQKHFKAPTGPRTC